MLVKISLTKTAHKCAVFAVVALRPLLNDIVKAVQSNMWHTISLRKYALSCY